LTRHTVTATPAIRACRQADRSARDIKNELAVVVRWKKVGVCAQNVFHGEGVRRRVMRRQTQSAARTRANASNSVFNVRHR
jgi:hypothetical protein